jgi:type IV pilus assembly protein PilB
MGVQPVRQNTSPTTAVVEPSFDAPPANALGAVLRAGGAITDTQLAEALAAKRDARLGDQLVRSGLVSEDVVAWAVAYQHGLPYVDLTKETPQPDAAAMITADASHAFQILPLRLHANRTLDVLVADPTDALVRRVLESLPVSRVRVGMAPPSQMRVAITRMFPGGSTPKAVEGDRRVRRVLEQILRQATGYRASDIHIEFADDRGRVRFRVDGVLRDSLLLMEDVARPLLAHLRQIAGIEHALAMGPQRGRFRYGVDGNEVDVRVGIAPTVRGAHCVLRLLDRSRQRLGLSELGMTPGVAALYAELAQTTSGLVLVSGPSRSGRTTTMYATLDAFDHTDRNVMAVEDTIELVVPGVNQVRVDHDAGFDFASAIEMVVMQDPDVVLIGDLPDLASCRLAIRAAMAGCLVIAAVPAIDAVDALWRLLDAGLDPRAVGSSVIAVENQRLLRRVCTGCAVVSTPSPRDLAFYTRRGGSAADTFVQGTGCETCGFTGYHGAIGVFEVLPFTHEITRELLAGAPPARIRDIAVAEGMDTLMHHALKLVADRVTTIDEVRRAL